MMKAVFAVLVLIGLLFSSAAAYGATPDAHFENRLAERIHGLCSYAQDTNEAGLSDLERFLAGEIAGALKLEEDYRNKWRRSHDSEDRKRYLRVVAVATIYIEVSSRVRQCIQARRITTNTPYLNVCGTNQGPLGCAGQFVGLYQARCFDPVATSDHGSGTLTVAADGTVHLKLQSNVHRSGGSDEVSGIMDRTGTVIIDQSSTERKIRYDGRFTVKSEPSRRLSGGGTYIYRSSAISCDGEFRLHDY